ncbi:hypothetical protein TNCV_3236001 [Trichonephila clavipes]|nr:hypothetical protein TNCV_3236001 [Trichonephila clavipes]
MKEAYGLYRDFTIPILKISSANSPPADMPNLIGQTLDSVSTSDSYNPAFQISCEGSGMCMIERYLQKVVLTSTFIEERTKGKVERRRSKPNSPVASASKDDLIRCSACEEEYCDSPTEEWI